MKTKNGGNKMNAEEFVNSINDGSFWFITQDDLNNKEDK